MGIDDADHRPPTDLPAEEQRAEPSVRTQIRRPSAVERIEAHLQARQVADKAYAERIGAEISAGQGSAQTRREPGYCAPNSPS